MRLFHGTGFKEMHSSGCESRSGVVSGPVNVWVGSLHWAAGSPAPRMTAGGGQPQAGSGAAGVQRPPRDPHGPHGDEAAAFSSLFS